MQFWSMFIARKTPVNTCSHPNPAAWVLTPRPPHPSGFGSDVVDVCPSPGPPAGRGRGGGDTLCWHPRRGHPTPVQPGNPSLLCDWGLVARGSQQIFVAEQKAGLVRGGEEAGRVASEGTLGHFPSVLPPTGYPPPPAPPLCLPH